MPLRVGPGVAFIEVVTFGTFFRRASMKIVAIAVFVAHSLASAGSVQNKTELDVGRVAKGDGPLAEDLEVAPADLTVFDPALDQT